MAIVYRHIRLDTNKVFYVGIATKASRPYSKFNRNKYWHNIVNKAGYSVEIIQENLSWEDACELECLLISEYGRKDLGTGHLVNMTIGGDGVVGIIITSEKLIKNRNSMLGKKHTEESKKLMSQVRIGMTFSEEHRKNLSLAKKNIVVRDQTKALLSKALKGKKKSAEHSLNIAKAKYKKVLDLITGQEFDSVKLAALHYGFDYKQLSSWLSGSRKNKTNLIYS